MRIIKDNGVMIIMENKMEHKVKNAAVLLMAGKSQRFQNNNNSQKQFVDFYGKEAFLYPLESLISSLLFDVIVLVCEADHVSEVKNIIEREYSNFKVDFHLVAGGKTRNESVFNGLKSLCNENITNVYIHDAARVILPKEILFNIQQALEKYDAVTPVVPVVDSLMKHGTYIDREDLYRVQTPQAFKYDKILEIYEGGYDEKDTDDFSKAVRAGLNCFNIKGSEQLYKLTYPEDKTIISALIKEYYK